jgi:hypothetical protein
MVQSINNKQTWLFFSLSLSLILIACGQVSSISSAKEDKTASKVYTDAGLTFAANNITTPSPQPTSTSTIFPTATLSPTITLPVFTETLSPSPTYVLSNFVACDNSAYVDDVTIPDGTILAPGQTFKKTWRLRNTGTCSWTHDYSIAFVSGNGMDGETTAINKYVAPGKAANITISLTVPDVEGEFTGYWQLTDKNGIRFGQLIYVQIVVSNDD